MNAKDFLEVAKKLQSSEVEAERRTSISRAYYAVFNYVKGFLNNEKIEIPKDASGHKKAYHYLLNSGLEEARKLADDLDNLREVRNDADYELISAKYEFSKINCGLTCHRAIQFFDRFNKIDRGSLLKGIWEYKRKTNN